MTARLSAVSERLSSMTERVSAVSERLSPMTDGLSPVTDEGLPETDEPLPMADGRSWVSDGGPFRTARAVPRTAGCSWGETRDARRERQGARKRIHHRGAEDTEENMALESPVGALSRARLGSMKMEFTMESTESTEEGRDEEMPR
ncbi:MAG: hypothetical protein WBS54_13225 [Acidobacteriota bacterium]